jgi:hypothetical protein
MYVTQLHRLPIDGPSYGTGQWGRSSPAFVPACELLYLGLTCDSVYFVSSYRMKQWRQVIMTTQITDLWNSHRNLVGYCCVSVEGASAAADIGQCSVLVIIGTVSYSHFAHVFSPKPVLFKVTRLFWWIFRRLFTTTATEWTKSESSQTWRSPLEIIGNKNSKSKRYIVMTPRMTHMYSGQRRKGLLICRLSNSLYA